MSLESQIWDSNHVTIEKTHPTLFYLPIVTMNLKRIVSVGIGLNIFLNRMVLDHHRTSHQLSDFQFLSLTNIRPFWIDTLNEIKIVVRRQTASESLVLKSLTSEGDIFLLTKCRIKFIWLAYGPKIACVPFINLFKDISPRDLNILQFLNEILTLKSEQKVQKYTRPSSYY